MNKVSPHWSVTAPALVGCVECAARAYLAYWMSSEWFSGATPPTRANAPAHCKNHYDVVETT
ncbi:MAG: hypothetical protein P4L92_11495 [Rudaea sp.]|nr:hypothetical protein [Rudaea sp.]